MIKVYRENFKEVLKSFGVSELYQDNIKLISIAYNKHLGYENITVVYRKNAKTKAASEEIKTIQRRRWI